MSLDAALRAALDAALGPVLEELRAVRAELARLKPPEPESGPELLSQAQVARYLGVNERTLRRWILAGRLPDPAFRIGGRPRWKRSMLEAVKGRSRRSRPKVSA